VKSLHLPVNACRDLQSLDVGSQTCGKVVAQPVILGFIKKETLIEVAKCILGDENFFSSTPDRELHLVPVEKTSFAPLHTRLASL
jgi:hypothetical protein